MQTSTSHPGIYIREASNPGQVSAEPGSPATPIQPGEDGQSGQNGSNADAGTTTGKPIGSSISSYAVRQFLLNGGDGTWMVREKLDLDALEKQAGRTGTYPGALLMTAPAVPVVAAMVSAIAFVAQWPKGVGLPDWLSPFLGTPLLIGTLPTLIAWLLFAIFLRRFTAVDLANITSFGALLDQLSTLDAQLDILCPQPQSGSVGSGGSQADAALSPAAVSVAIACKEALDSRNSIYKKLTKRNLAWISATGYIDLWQEMNHAQEALIDMMPREIVIGEALYDELRLLDSQIDTHDELLTKLREAVTALDPSAENYLKQPPPAGVLLPANVVAANTDPAEVDMQARSVLREVRYALNQFRTDRWHGIVRARNQLVSTMILTGIIMYVLLEFAILAGASVAELTTATAFYLVGALVGLFSRLVSESQVSKSIDDYRLAVARLVATPVFAGLAAVGGVLITQKFTTLVDIYDPKNILSGLIVAAIFGLTPNLLINTLQAQANRMQDELKSTAATQGQGPKTT